MMTDPFLACSTLASDPSKHSVPSSHSQERPLLQSGLWAKESKQLIVYLKEVSGVEFEQLCKCSKNEGVFSQKKKVKRC